MIILLCLPGASSLAEGAGEAEPETFSCEDYEYALLDDGTAEITKYHGEAEALEVPGELDGYAVTAIGDGAFYGCSGLMHAVEDMGIQYAKKRYPITASPAVYSSREFSRTWMQA